MKRVRPFRLLALAAGVLALQGCVQNTVTTVPLEGYYLTSANRLIGFGTADGARALVSTTLATVTGEALLDIDYRASEGRLYALGSLGGIYTISNGTAVRISTLTAGTLVSGVRYVLDIDPVSDRMRVLGGNGDNLLVEINSGRVTRDTSIAITGTAAPVAGAAFTDKTDATEGRVSLLYTLDAAGDAVHTLNPARTGTTTRVAGLGLDATAIVGYDINPATGKGHAVLTVGGSNSLYRIDETVTGATPAASFVSGTPAMLSGESIVGMAFITPVNPTVLALDNGGGSSGLRQFAASTPGVLGLAQPVTGLAGGETLLAIDSRYADSKLYALSSLGKTYSIDENGTATALAATLTVNAAQRYLIDMSPVTSTTAPVHQGLMHVINATTLQKHTLDVDNGTASAATAITPGTASLVGSAFSSALFGTSAHYAVDLATATLQTLADNGSLTRYNSLGLSLAGSAGFDISGSFDDNTLLAGRSGASGPFTLYRLTLNTTANTPVSLGQIGGASGPATLVDIAIRR